MASDHQATVREIIAENQYMTVATTDGERPWVAPVQFCTDEDLNFYFVSLPTSRHAEHIAQNPRVGLATFDSQQPPFTGRGVQVDGVASKYSDEENPFATNGGLDMPTNLQELGRSAPKSPASVISTVDSWRGRAIAGNSVGPRTPLIGRSRRASS